ALWKDAGRTRTGNDRIRGRQCASRSRIREGFDLRELMLIQFSDWVTALSDDRLRPPLSVDPVGAQIDAKVVEDSGADVGGGNAVVPHFASPGVRASDDLAMSETATGHQHGHTAGPVLPT